jgi:hypothetical protein
MKQYNPQLPLFALHVPKTAGHSFIPVLKRFFPNRFFQHNYDLSNQQPPIFPQLPGSCIYGHFHSRLGGTVEDYYPEACQFVTILRDPLQAAISAYFYWKEKVRARQLQQGNLVPGAPQDYRSIDDFFRQRPKSSLLKYLPRSLTAANYREYFESQFVWVGVLDYLQRDVDRLANILGAAPVVVGHKNLTTHNEELSVERRHDFFAQNQLEFQIYNYVCALAATASEG